MSRVFITGSSTGLGFMAAQLLVETGIRSSVTAATRRAPMQRSRLFLAWKPWLSAICSVSGKRNVVEQVTGSAGSMP